MPSVGEISVNGNAAGERDGIYAGDEESLEIVLKTDGEIVLADLPLI